MRYLPLLILLFALPAGAQTTFYLRASGEVAGDISGCVGTDHGLSETIGASAQTATLTDDTPDTENWNFNDVAGEERSGTWDCHFSVTCDSGGGPPNAATIQIERVDSSCVSQQTILTHVSGALTEGGQTVIECTDVTSTSATFAAGEGIMVTVWQSNGNQNCDLDYNGAAEDNAFIIVPDVVAGPTATPTPGPTPTPAPTARRVMLIQ